MSDKELTVEECLAELREMFPKHWIYVDEQANSSVSPKGKQHIDRRALIQIDDAQDGFIYEGQYATTLSKAMAEVRAWKESQQ